ncbi:MAG: hypothetical protein ABR552_05850 [Actinomycetota bacterium]
MKKRSPTDLFADLVEGAAVDASAEVNGLAALASALAPADRAGLDPRSKARMRSGLLAAASALEEEAIERFAVAIEDQRAMVPEARELVSVAAALEPSRLPVPSPAFRYGLRSELAAGAPQGARERTVAAFSSINSRMRRSLRAVTATGLVAALLAASGATFAASASALPTDALYKVKRFKEATELFAASGPHKGFLYLDDARNRLDEVRGMTLRAIRAPGPYISTFDAMDDETVQGEIILIDSYRSHLVGGDALRRVSRFARVQVADLSALIDHIPDGAQPRARDSLIVAARVALRAENVLADCPCSSDALENAPIPGSSTSAVGCSCEPVAPSSGGSGGSNNSSSGSNNGDGGGAGGGGGNKPPTNSKPGPVDLPPVSGAEPQEQTVEDLLNQLLNPVVKPVPTATETPSLPIDAPTSTPAVPLTIPSVGL